MKLLRVGELGRERPGVLGDDGLLRDLGQCVDDIGGTAFNAQSLARIQQIDVSKLPLIEDADALRIGACIANPGKFICIGRNYADHAKEMGDEPPTEPVVFDKWLSAICGANDPIIQPRGSTKLDWEVELGVVVGEILQYASEAAAARAIAGYCLINDVSERAFQKERGGQWIKGKGCDSFGPIGPWFVTADELDASDLKIWLDVNGKRQQEDTTANMLFKPAFLVSYLSQFMTLLPGDVIATGTPSGVGAGQTPPNYLKPGDVVELGIDGLGVQRHLVMASP